MNAFAVIGDANQATAGFFEVEVDARREGVDAVLEEFFDNTGRALDDFACGNFVDQAVVELTDATGVFVSRGRCGEVVRE